MRLPDKWEHYLENEFDLSPFYDELDHFIGQFKTPLMPRKEWIFRVFHMVPPHHVNCVLFGEDPYPRVGSACGIAFWDSEISDWNQKTHGNSLKNMMKALRVHQKKAVYTTSIENCRNGLEPAFPSPDELFENWLLEGIFLINTALTFTKKEDKKLHFNFWAPFQKALIKTLNTHGDSPYYILWGNKAKRRETDILASIDNPHKIISQGHPTFIHQFLNKNEPHFSPFTEIIEKTTLKWI